MNIVLFGAGGHGREVADVLLDSGFEISKLFFCESTVRVPSVNGIPVISMEKLALHNRKSTFVHIALGDPSARAQFTEIIEGLGFSMKTILGKSVNVSKHAVIGLGSFIAPYTFVGPNVRLGKSTILNYFSSISHDSQVEDFVTISPGAKINGNIKIGSKSFIGSNATIINGSKSTPIVIGAQATIGAGSVVIRSVGDLRKVAGNPAKYIDGL